MAYRMLGDSIQGGSRIYESSGASSDVIIGSTLEGTIETTEKGILSGSSLIGTRNVNQDSELAGYDTGTHLTASSVDSNRSYSLMTYYSIGQRIVDHDTVQFQGLIALEEDVAKKGIGTFGFMTPRVVEKTKENQVRRWPREWHGTNM